ncbi:MAG: flagellar biosynthetic protein FliO [Planctomycetaceae bacterium]|nr:flagellar biosynthetic protein FliO [Planctomycetaceae bacterium]
MTRCHRHTLRARITLGVAFALAMPALALAFDARLPPPEYARSATNGDQKSTIVPVDLTAGEADSKRVSRRITPRGETSSSDASSRPGLPSAGSVLSALALVMLAIFAAARLWKIHGPKLPSGVPREAAEVLGRCRIEAKQSLYLVRLGSRILVLGSGNGELTTLSEITDTTEVDLITAQCRSGSGAASPFSRLFEARQASQAESTPITIEAEPSPFTVRPTLGSAERRLAERFRGHASDKEPGHVA